MKALSLHQPWASLVAHGLKKIETRGPRSPRRYRGPLLIHAAKVFDADAYHALWERFDEVRCAWLESVPPLGAIVAVARVVDIREMTPEWIAEQTPLERAVGDWQPGRFGWVLEDVRRFAEPIPYAGKQGLFEVVDARVNAALEAWSYDPLGGLRG